MRNLLKGLNPLRWTPANWASLKPFGIGEQRPNNFAEVFRALWENRDNLRYAWRVLDRGVCDGCALGTTGMKDWTLEGVHLCNIRLRLLRLNTMPALDTSELSDISDLKNRRARDLRQMGRLPHPMIRRKGEKGFQQISWDDALDMIAERIGNTTPDRLGFYLTSRGMVNESYYGAQKAVRALGTNSVDNAARICHSPSTGGLKRSIGAGATTCSWIDWIGSDLIVFFGSNVANNQPVATKYLHYAKKEGTRIEVVNPYREPGMDKYWVPSNPESALFGTQITDRFNLVNVGGDIAFINGAIKHMIEHDLVDRNFIDNYTDGFDELERSLDDQPWSELERLSGVSEAEMRAFGQTVGEAETAVFVWSMGVTQHEHGENNVQAIINLGLTKGFVGRDKCGLMPIRGHSGVQGGAEMGCYSTAFPGGVPVGPESAQTFSEFYGFEVSPEPGHTATDMIDAAYDGNMELLFAAGGNFLDVLAQRDYVEQALSNVPLRVHMDIMLNPQMFVDPSEDVILLPAMTRYEIPGGVTQTSTERRVMFSPEIPGSRPGEVRPEWDVFLEVARRARPDLAEKLTFKDTAEIREEIAQAVPTYDGIQHLQQEGDVFQYGGAHLCANWTFKTHDGKAHFDAVPLPLPEVPEGHFRVTTRRGKQFNSMVQAASDKITGKQREAVLINEDDAERYGVRNGEPVTLRNHRGVYQGYAAISPVKPGNLQVHWPEGNVLLDYDRRSPEARVPDYNAVVTLERRNGQGTSAQHADDQHETIPS